MSRWGLNILWFLCGILAAVNWITFIHGNPSDLRKKAKTESQAEFQQQAIDAGVAEWTVDAKTGETTFEWIKGNSDEL